MKRKALGKGLRSLIPEASKRRTAPAVTSVEPMSPAPTSDPALRRIDVDRIWPNPHQPRKEFDQEALEGLAEADWEEGSLVAQVGRFGFERKALEQADVEKGQFTDFAGLFKIRKQAAVLRAASQVRGGQFVHFLKEKLIVALGVRRAVFEQSAHR